MDVRECDANALPFLREFDAVFSNAALHWMRDPDAVVRGIARSASFFVAKAAFGAPLLL